MIKVQNANRILGEALGIQIPKAPPAIAQPDDHLGLTDALSQRFEPQARVQSRYVTQHRHQAAAFKVRHGFAGAGGAATASAMLALFPPIVLVMVGPIILLLVITRYASVASLTTAAVSPFVMLLFVLNGSAPWSFFVLNVVVSVIIVVVHIPNIQRLRAGTERRFGQRLSDRRRDKS
jgi:hypothetical protein